MRGRKSVTPKEYTNLLEYITQNNCWEINMYGITVERKRKAIKYAEASFDSRDGTIWLITFQQIINSKEQEISFSIESKEFTVGLMKQLHNIGDSEMKECKDCEYFEEGYDSSDGTPYCSHDGGYEYCPYNCQGTVIGTSLKLHLICRRLLILSNIQCRIQFIHLFIK